MFDTRISGFHPDPSPLLALLFIAAGLLWVRFGNRPRERVLGALFALVSLLSFGGVYESEHGEYSRIVHALNSGRYELVEEFVQEFVPGEPHRPETFRVGAHRYEYSPFEESAGYRRTMPEGGVIRPGLQLRIFDVDGVIGRLEVGKAIELTPTR